MAGDERTAEGLPDEAVVIRGGYMNFKNFDISIGTHHEHYDEYALSVFCLPGCDSGEEVADQCPKFRGEVFRETTVGRIRAAGYEIVGNEPPKGHALIKGLPSSSSSEDWRREDWQKLKAVFGVVKDNPHYE